MSGSVDHLRSTLADERTVPAPSRDVTDRPCAPFPMTPTQQALWIGRGEAVDLGNVGCYGYFEWERPTLDLDRYRAAWRRVVDHHPALRTVARPDGTQCVLTDLPDVPVTVTDLRGRPDADVVLTGLREDLGHRALDPTSWPLFDVRVTWLDGGVRLHLGIDLQVMDASSLFRVLFPDLISAYEDPDTELRTPGISFRDYVIWCSGQLLGTDAYRQDARWWSERIADLPPAPDLPMPPSGVGGQSGTVRFERRYRELDATGNERLRGTAARLGVSTSCVLTGLFSEVLRGWSSQRELTLNYPVFDRHPLHPDVDALAGDFTNPLPLAARGTGNTFAERLTELDHELAQARAHGRVNGIQVMRWLATERGTSAPTLPVVVTSLLDVLPARSVNELGHEVFSISQTPQVSLDFQIRDLDGRLRLIWDFLAGAFAPGIVDGMFERFVAVLDELVAADSADPEGPWHAHRFDLLPAADRALRARVNDTARPVSDALLHERFFAEVRRHPDAEAVIDPTRRLTYGELGTYARRIAHVLRTGGVAVDELVAIVMDKGWEQYAAVYGILAAGAAYLPVDVGDPPERLARLLATAGVRTVLTQSAVDRRLRWPDVVRRHRVDADFEAGDDSPLLPVQSADDLAYVIFTSGSTGEPKGVMVEHRGVGNLVDDVHRRFRVTGSDRLLAISGLHFDASVFDVFGILSIGGAIVLPAPFERAEPDYWTNLVRDERITVWNSVPVLMELLVGEVENRDDRPLATLRLAVLSGDWIPLSLPGRLHAQTDRIQVVGSGGPTETICWSLFYPITDVDPAWRSIPYGKPLSNQRYHVVDEDLRERPTWVPGEMAVASPVGLARGYVADEARTAERFVLLPGTGERAYLTGDLGRCLPDGNIEILGRNDFQVKIAGHRIELGEIEVALTRLPGVGGAVVVAPVSAHSVRRLHGYVIPGLGTALDTEELRSGLTRVLPNYMVPPSITVLDHFPLTRNGKVDRRLLAHQGIGETPAPYGTDQPGGGVLDTDALCSIVQFCVSDVLGVGSVEPTDNFFRLGGDSLSGTRVAARLHDLLGVPVPIRTVFDNPEIGVLAAAIARDPESGVEAARVSRLLDCLTAEDLGPSS